MNSNKVIEMNYNLDNDEIKIIEDLTIVENFKDFINHYGNSEIMNSIIALFKNILYQHKQLEEINNDNDLDDKDLETHKKIIESNIININNNIKNKILLLNNLKKNQSSNDQSSNDQHSITLGKFLQPKKRKKTTTRKEILYLPDIDENEYNSEEMKKMKNMESKINEATDNFIKYRKRKSDLYRKKK